jgi:hypothetical protein
MGAAYACPCMHVIDTLQTQLQRCQNIHQLQLHAHGITRSGWADGQTVEWLRYSIQR